jgi:hypothetical protein
MRIMLSTIKSSRILIVKCFLIVCFNMLPCFHFVMFLLLFKYMNLILFTAVSPAHTCSKCCITGIFQLAHVPYWHLALVCHFSKVCTVVE